MLCLCLCYVGDFNLNLLQYNHHVTTLEFIDNVFSHAFCPLISQPSRLTSYSATLIDKIFTNNLSQNVFNGIVLSDLSDHLPVFTCFLQETLTRKREKKFFSRAINANNLKKLKLIWKNQKKLVFNYQRGRPQWSLQWFYKRIFQKV